MTDRSMSQVKSKQRVADHGEVFTPAWMVEAMLDLVKDDTERIDSRFLEPACGSGNFLTQVLVRKLAAVERKFAKSGFERRHYALLGLMCVYGIELLADNIAECRSNLLEILADYLDLEVRDDLYRAAAYVLSQNLVHGDALAVLTHDGEPITFAEWGYLGKGKFQRRDFRLDILTQSAAWSQEGTLFAQLGKHEIFTAVKTYPPMTVSELASATLIGTTYLTSLLARRSVYCSKHANGERSIAKGFASDDGNIWFERTEHTWVDGKCTYCGASQKTLDRGEGLETHAYVFIHTDNIRTRVAEFLGGDMQFDVIIGNPPYQLGDGGGGGGASATPIYNLFVEAALSLEPRYAVMITPSRWFSGGKGLDEFRARMLRNHRLVKLVDFPQLYDVFPGVKIRGGVSYWLWGRDHDGDCEVATMIGNEIIGAPVVRNLDAYDVLVRRNEAVRILDKVAGYRINGKPEPSLGDQVSARKPFGLTNQRGKPTPAGVKNPVLVYGNQHTSYLPQPAITSNVGWIDQWKVLLVKAHGTSGRDDLTILGEPVVAGPRTACTETYLVVGVCPSEAEARHLAAYMRTRFVRFLVSLRKITQNITRDSYRFVPLLPMNRQWTDEDLYERYDITSDQITFIESLIADRPSNESGQSADEDDVQTHELRAMGPVMRRAATLGYIAPTDRYRLSSRISAHKNPRRVWRSLIYEVAL